MRSTFRNYTLLAAAMVPAFTSVAAEAGPLRELLKEQRGGARAERSGDRSAYDPELVGGGSSCKERAAQISGKMSHVGANGPTPNRRDVAYGSRTKETLDVYTPKNAHGNAPMIVMVHGGGWCVGDKAMSNVTENKVARWVPKGFVFVSVNYPMIPEGDMALAQAHTVAQAIAYIQQHGQEWGGDTSRIILMGHSAGAHLVSLVNADSAIRASAGVKPVLGTVSIDSGSINTVSHMQNLHAPKVKARFEEAFGTDPKGWEQTSPYHRLSNGASPWFGVCTKRNDNPCGEGEEYARKSQSLGIRAQVYSISQSHGKSNAELGKPGEYTNAVEQFMASLDPLVGNLLK